jgi:DNA double-strand break repair helicase HerA and related ATPase
MKDLQGSFKEAITQGYTFKGDAILLGTAMLGGKPVAAVPVSVPLKTLNRHGLIAGATGTGKTKTLQKITESLSAVGVPVLLMDMKGDVSGISQPGSPHPKIDERHAAIGTPWTPTSFPVEFLTLSEEHGTRLRATVSEFGPVLFSKILDLNDTQAGVVSLIFKYCDDKQLPLLDLKDFKKTLQFLTNEGKEELRQEYGALSTATTGTILRKIVEIEQEGADTFFGERSFEVEDLLRTDKNGRGIVSIIRLTDIQNKPRMFSTFMLCLLAEVYSSFPEVGDPDKPRLAIFMDEAHLIFKEASKALLEQMETIIKLIRSKGVGVFFCTQSPADIPASVLGQLGLKVQHALRAFTANDRKSIKQAAENYPLTEFYDTDAVLTSMGIGEAFVTGLNEKGIPTPLVHTYLCAPESRMDPITDPELQTIVASSALAGKYNESIDRQSAYEMLSAKIQPEESAPEDPQRRKSEGPSTLEKIVSSPVTRQIGRTVARELTRGLLGVLGISSIRRRRSSR